MGIVVEALKCPDLVIFQTFAGSLGWGGVGPVSGGQPWNIRSHRLQVTWELSHKLSHFWVVTWSDKNDFGQDKQRDCLSTERRQQLALQGTFFIWGIRFRMLLPSWYSMAGWVLVFQRQLGRKNRPTESQVTRLFFTTERQVIAVTRIFFTLQSRAD